MIVQMHEQKPPTSMSITRAREELTKLPERLMDSPEAITVTRRGAPVLAVLPWELYESLLETLEIMADDELMASLRQGISDLEAGRVTQLEDVVAELEL